MGADGSSSRGGGEVFEFGPGAAVARAKPQITRAEYLQLLGLLTLAERHNKSLEEIRAAAAEITGERDSHGAPSDNGHTADAVYGSRDLDELLRLLNIAVDDPPIREDALTPVAATPEKGGDAEAR
jgi:hypothetical protein